MPKGIYKHKKRGPQSKETRRKISLALMGHTFSKETIKKFSQMRKGKPTWNKGIPHSAKTRAKISASIRGINNPRWKGGRRKASGYIWVKNPSHPYSSKTGYVAEHRLVIEKIIGRYLLPTEHVHHRGKKSCNYPHKLIAFVSCSAHKRFEQGGKVKPKEIIFDGRKLAI